MRGRCQKRLIIMGKYVQVILIMIPADNVTMQVSIPVGTPWRIDPRVTRSRVGRKVVDVAGRAGKRSVRMSRCDFSNSTPYGLVTTSVSTALCMNDL
jgi:hypothetical protein